MDWHVWAGAAIIAAIICAVIVGCTWKISGRMSGMETALTVNTSKVDATHLMVSNHSHECDVDRGKTGVKIDGLADRLDAHDHRFDELEPA